MRKLMIVVLTIALLFVSRVSSQESTPTPTPTETPTPTITPTETPSPTQTPTPTVTPTVTPTPTQTPTPTPSPTPTPLPQRGGKYLTLLYPRAVYVSYEQLGFVNLDRVKEFLDSKSLKATVSVVTSVPKDSESRIFNGTVYPSWEYLKRLQDTGWTVTSHSRTYANLEIANVNVITSEVNGSLEDLKRRGFLRAWSLFSYPVGRRNALSMAAVKNVYSYGRINAGGVNKLPDYTPEVVTVFAAQGGNCNNQTLPCYTFTEPKRRYVKPSYLIQKINLISKDQWAIMQSWRFVEGSGSYGVARWNCEGPEDTHWTLINGKGRELYCFNDYQAIITSLRQDIVVTTPDVVATLYGRLKN